jgi:hypothetical protein
MTGDRREELKLRETGGRTMKEITRSEAEDLFQTHSIKDREVQQTTRKLSIEMSISDNDNLIVRYDIPKREKRYFLRSK